jgi:hypothetical protein
VARRYSHAAHIAIRRARLGLPSVVPQPAGRKLGLPSVVPQPAGRRFGLPSVASAKDGRPGRFCPLDFWV